MPNLKELREKRADLMTQANALGEKPTLSAEEQAKFDQLMADVKALDEGDLKRAIELDELNRRSISMPPVDGAQTSTAGAPITVGYVEQRGDKPKHLVERASIVRGMQMVHQGIRLSGAEAELHQEGEKAIRAAGRDVTGFAIPFQFEKRDLTVGTTTAGGHTVATVLGELIPYLQPRVVTADLGAQVFGGLSSNLTFPRNNGTVSASWYAENGTISEVNMTYDTLALTPKRLGATTDVSKQLLLQSSVPMGMEQHVQQELSRAIARALDTAALNGSGSSNQPTGILSTSGIGSYAIGTNGGAPTYAMVVDLEADVAGANADMGSLAYLVHPVLAGKMKQVAIDSGSGRFLYEGKVGATGVRVGTVNAYDAAMSTLCPSGLTKGSSSDCYAVIFGNWNELLIAQWGGLDITVDPYSKKTSGLVEVTVQSWWDIGVRHAASFSACVDARNA